MGVQFLFPFALIALITLPFLWLLLRATPPAPLRAMFPPLNLLRDLQDDEETPDSAPLWLRLLRLGIAALIILALGAPVWSPRGTGVGQGPLLLVMDNGWASAPGWEASRKDALGLISATPDRVAVLFTASANVEELRFTAQATARKQVRDENAKPWPPVRARSLATIDALAKVGGLPKDVHIVWLSDGLDHGQARAFMDGLAAFGPVQVYTPAKGAEPLLLGPPMTSARGLEIRLQRPAPGAARTIAVQAIDEDGSVMAQADLGFAAGETLAKGEFVLPLLLRNRLKMLQVPEAPSAGTSWIFDGGWSRPLVGLITPGGDVDRQPLLSGFYYLDKAMKPHAELIRGELDELLAQEPSVLVLTDPAQPTAAGLVKLDAFVRGGGLLIRFAGPHLAANGDELVPVNLRAGGRLMGGAFGWETPQALAPFAQESPFFGLKGGQDAAVRRQVLALPDDALNERVWARLQDGTPLVSSAPHGAGRIVLFHVTAAPKWSDLPLSGLFAAMLERTLAFAKGRPGATLDQQKGSWELESALNAQGQMQTLKGAPPFLPANADFAKTVISAQMPPGLYRSGPFTRALNLGAVYASLKPLPTPLAGVTFMSGNASRSIAFKAPLLLLALILLGVDLVAALWLAGRLRILRKVLPTGSKAAVMLLGMLMALSVVVPKAQADEAFDRAIKAAQDTELAYIITGDRRVDAMSKAGLFGLSRTLIQRTTVEPAAPIGVNPAVDDLSVFSFIYWPVLRPPTLSAKAVAALDAYLKNGGMLVIDTQDGELRAKAAGGVDPALKSVFSQISVPALRPVDRDHVLTRTYYLIHDFPGRYTNGRVWVESDANGSSLDGVSGIIAGSNDWAAAWALDKNGRPMAALSDDIPRQREMARRFGINLVMYALTGNYKADQVHIPALLERLGEQ
ncbi:MAG: DUF4159 domain-containing protein [Robiginitomaculum sp.]|nr:DUF4159 domain-containing protein [Robiginitomaculum sp.]MDQ7076785.1 DUF4159 domain-containing protein [Robiginitomaculum sp.]